MPVLEWDKTSEHFFEAGVEKGVFYPYNTETKQYDSGFAWNGLTAVNESPSGAEATALWADNTKYLSLISNEEFGATVEAYTFPEEFGECDGTAELAPGIHIGQQKRKTFGMSYVTKLGNDIEGVDYGFKIHLIYGATAAPSAKDYSTINDSPDAITFSWELSTVPVAVTGFKPTAHLVIDSTKVTESNLKKLTDALWGSSTESAHLPLPDEIATLVKGE